MLHTLVCKELFSGVKNIPKTYRNRRYVSRICDANCFPNKPWFLPVCSTTSFENSVGKKEKLLNEQFLLFPQCFLPVLKTFFHFHQI